MKRLVLIIFVSLLCFSCSVIFGKLSGVYTAEGASLIEKVRFETDGTCHVTSMGFSMAMQYEVKGNKVIVGYQGQMVPTFEIVDSKTLRGITMGMADSYKKQD